MLFYPFKSSPLYLCIIRLIHTRRDPHIRKSREWFQIFFSKSEAVKILHKLTYCDLLECSEFQEITLFLGRILSRNSSKVQRGMEAKNLRSTFSGFQSGRNWKNSFLSVKSNLPHSPKKGKKQQIDQENLISFRLVFCRIQDWSCWYRMGEKEEGRKLNGRLQYFFCSFSTLISFQNMNYNKIQEPFQIQ